MKIALLTDLHLPDRQDTIKEEILDWALHTAVAERAQLIVSAGDMILAGAVEAARRLQAKLAASGLPFLMASGNTELDTPEVQDIFSRKIFQSLDHGIAAVIFPEELPGQEEQTTQLKKLLDASPESFLLVGHYPPDQLPYATQMQMEELLHGQRGAIFVAGHEHCDRTLTFTGSEVHVVRGMDPDKTIGGPPALFFFEYESASKKWRKKEVEYPSGGPESWRREEIHEFIGWLGISSMHDPVAGIHYAALRRIPCLEMRFEAIRELPAAELLNALDFWRENGGKILSLHFPDIVWDVTKGILAENETDKALELAVSLKANRLTIHVPRCPVCIMKVPRIKDCILQAYASLIDHALSKTLSVGIENLHMRPGEKADEHRGFGYTPAECIAWITKLRELCRSPKIGLHFDIGHARNNTPYSSIFTISQWYAEAGCFINGYHLHQVCIGDTGELKNHQPITCIYGPLISYFSFFCAWHSRQIAHEPIFIETDDGIDLSYNTFRNCFPSQEKWKS